MGRQKYGSGDPIERGGRLNLPGEGRKPQGLVLRSGGSVVFAVEDGTEVRPQDICVELGSLTPQAAKTTLLEFTARGTILE